MVSYFCSRGWDSDLQTHVDQLPLLYIVDFDVGVGAGNAEQRLLRHGIP
jgi:hypothetical protein